MPPTDIDRNLLFGVLAMQRDMIDQPQFAEACSVWALGIDRPLADVLIERGWITNEDRSDLERDIERKLRKHRGDVRATLGAVAGADARDAIRAVDHPEVRKSLSGLPPAQGHVLIETLAPPNRQEGSRYTLTRLHAEGGLGKVWVARDGDLNREVALKEIRPEGGDHAETWRRFLKEAQITGQLEHPNIVPVYELARRKEDDQPFYTMKFVHGQTLRDAIAEFHRNGGPADRLELQKLLAAFINICEAVGYAHSRGVVHRDLKPENVVLGGFGEVIVLDWGLARMIDQPEEEKARTNGAPALSVTAEAETARTMGQVGTPQYMAPEQVEARHDLIDGRTDVYALGGILFEILTGRPPAEGATTAEVFNKILAGSIPRARDLVPEAPRPLEAICAKAVARDRAARYARAIDLAEDVRRWVADEPVSAWREPLTTRARRWVGRHRSGVTATMAAALVALAAGGYLLYETRLRAAERLTAAIGRVDALTTAEVRSLPLIVEQLGADRGLVRDRLEGLARGDDDHSRLAAALALLADDPTQADFLSSRLLAPEATPDEVLVICEALATARLGDKAVTSARQAIAAKAADLTDAQFRAAAALAGLASSDPALTPAAGPIARKLVRENPLLVGGWREVFQPIAPTLVGPLREIYARRDEPEPRALAFTMLYEFATQPKHPREADDLAALVGDAEPDQFHRLLARLGSAANRDRAVTIFEPKVKEPARFDDELARRQGRMALALLRLGRPDRVWPLLRHRDDPTVRTELIHNLARFGFDPAPVAERLQGGAEADVSARRALILCLGQFPPESVPDRQALAAEFLARYRADPDPGVHGNLDWLLRVRWGRAADLEAIDKELAGTESPKGRDWYVNGQGQTYTIVRGPVEFLMGSTKSSDPVRYQDEVQHTRRIDRSFAIAAREVTVAEYARFLDEKPEGVSDHRANPQVQQNIPTADCANGAVTWYEAARYCNWLSARERLPKDQWCYPAEIGPGMKLPSDYLRRTGYRLPTEAEWEYACRAGSASSRPQGGPENWLAEYGWYLTNSGRTKTMHPAGRKTPNDLGLFDTLGNAYEWCTDPFGGAYRPDSDNRATIDSIVDADFSDDVVRVRRGGSYGNSESTLRAADRSWIPPVRCGTEDGFRPARTYH
jgi:formylglycine-generating enzyme required for sulfatase activity/tRNA A-37 threonylcarbamoyl transferase component Bud32